MALLTLGSGSRRLPASLRRWLGLALLGRRAVRAERELRRQRPHSSAAALATSRRGRRGLGWRCCDGLLLLFGLGSGSSLGRCDCRCFLATATATAAAITRRGSRAPSWPRAHGGARTRARERCVTKQTNERTNEAGTNEAMLSRAFPFSSSNCCIHGRLWSARRALRASAVSCPTTQPTIA